MFCDWQAAVKLVCEEQVAIGKSKYTGVSSPYSFLHYWGRGGSAEWLREGSRSDGFGVGLGLHRPC